METFWEIIIPRYRESGACQMLHMGENYVAPVSVGRICVPKATEVPKMLVIYTYWKFCTKQYGSARR